MSLDAHAESQIRDAAARAGAAPEPLLAIAEIEAEGRVLIAVAGGASPPIRFRPHVFRRRLRPELRDYAASLGLASQERKARSGRGFRAEWALFERARRIDAEAASAACAWGFGAVSGERALRLGFESAEAMGLEACAGVSAQAHLLIRRLDEAGLRAALEAGEWSAYARARTREGCQPESAGEALARELSASVERWRRTDQRPSPPPTLGIGAQGGCVARLQRLLADAGWSTPVDGVFGATTRAAVRAAQDEFGLVRDGLSRPSLWRELESLSQR